MRRNPAKNPLNIHFALSLKDVQTHIGKNLPIYVFIGFYLLTVVIGNIVYVTSFGHPWPNYFVNGFWEKFPPSFLGIEFLLLLLFPMVAIPLIAYFSKSAVHKPVKYITSFMPEFSKTIYTAISILLYVYVIFSLYQADSIELLCSGETAIEAVNNRFLLLSRLGMWPLIAMQSLLPFMAIYAVISALRKGGWFWHSFVVWHVFVLSSCFVLLNMKWPLVLWDITLSWAVLISARNHIVSILMCFLIMVLSVVSYVGVSVAILRLSPYPPKEKDPTEFAYDLKFLSNVFNGFIFDALMLAHLDFLTDKFSEEERVIYAHSQKQLRYLGVVAINRMALPVPYYYKMLSEKDQPHISVFHAAIKKDPSDSPSLLVYQDMFEEDGFAGRGTAPAAAHITGYALDGWVGVIMSIFLVGIAMGCFLALWPMVHTSSMIATIFVMGGQAAYFWSQLPLEGPILYTHGILWWGFLAVCYALFVFLRKRLSVKTI